MSVAESSVYFEKMMAYALHRKAQIQFELRAESLARKADRFTHPAVINLLEDLSAKAALRALWHRKITEEMSANWRFEQEE